MLYQHQIHKNYKCHFIKYNNPIKHQTNSPNYHNLLITKQIIILKTQKISKNQNK